MRVSRIILFEDDPSLAETTRMSLDTLGYQVLGVFPSADAALESVAELKPDLILMDIELAGSTDGIQAATEIHRRFGIPIVFTTGLDDKPTILRALETKPFGYVIKPYGTQELEAAIEMALYRVQRDKERDEILEKTVGGSIKILTEILSVIDTESFGRGQKLRNLMLDLAQALKIPTVWELEVAAVMSHIGFVLIPNSIVRKHRLRVPLNSVEHALLTRCPEFGNELLMRVPNLEPVAQIVLYQNKEFDGSGFPDDSISGAEIPLGARMLRVLGDYIDMESAGTSKAHAIEIMNKASGRYDPKMLQEAILSVIDAPPKGAKPLKLSELKIGQLLMASVETMDGTVLVAAGQTLSNLSLKRLSNFDQLSGIKEPIYVASGPTPASAL